MASYNSAPFPNAYPAFPDQSQSYAQPQFGWQQGNGAPQQQPQQQQANMDFGFYSPPQPQQQQQQPGMNMQPQPQMPLAGANDWNNGPPSMDGGARHRAGGAPHPSMADPNNVAMMGNQLMANPMAGMALDYGKAHLAKNLSWVMSFLSALRYYFHVNNRYVVAKIRVLLLPFLHQNWKRERIDGAQSSADDGSVLAGLVGTAMYKLPRDDINAPDLYIPTMAFVTFTLLMGYALGVGNQFHPEVLGLTASRTLILLFFEVLGLKGGLYLISVGPVLHASLLDLISYAAYKYIHCILMIIVGLFLGSTCFYIAILLLGTLAALFMMRTMKRVCAPSHVDQSNGYSIGTGSSFGQGVHRRNYFLLFIGAIQILFSWFLVRTANAGF